MNGLRYTPEINGVLYSWADVTVTIGGTLVKGIRKVSYKDEQQIDPIYGVGQHVVGRGYGRITSTASITLLRDEIEAIREASDTGRLQDIAPFDVIVSFVPTSGKKVVTHKILDCQFKTDGLDISEGDTSNEVECELIVSHIERK